MTMNDAFPFTYSPYLTKFAVTSDGLSALNLEGERVRLAVFCLSGAFLINE